MQKSDQGFINLVLHHKGFPLFLMWFSNITLSLEMLQQAIAVHLTLSALSLTFFIIASLLINIVFSLQIS